MDYCFLAIVGIYKWLQGFVLSRSALGKEFWISEMNPFNVGSTAASKSGAKLESPYPLQHDFEHICLLGTKVLVIRGALSWVYTVAGGRAAGERCYQCDHGNSDHNNEY